MCRPAARASPCGRAIAAIGVDGDALQIKVAVKGIAQVQVKGRRGIANAKEGIGIVRDADAVDHRVAGIVGGGDDILVNDKVRFDNVDFHTRRIAAINNPIDIGTSAIRFVFARVVSMRLRIMRNGIKFDNDILGIGITIIVGQVSQLEEDIRSTGIGISIGCRCHRAGNIAIRKGAL